MHSCFMYIAINTQNCRARRQQRGRLQQSRRSHFGPSVLQNTYACVLLSISCCFCFCLCFWIRTAHSNVEEEMTPNPQQSRLTNKKPSMSKPCTAQRALATEAVNAVLIFGQDIEDYADLYRAIMTVFRAMFGDRGHIDLDTHEVCM